PRTYYRLMERYNLAVWPWHIATLGLGLGLLALLRGKTAWQGRSIAGVLALLWAWVAWAFLWQRYATINWAAVYILPLFTLEALLLVWIGLVRNKLTFQITSRLPGVAGTALLAFSVVGYPALAPVLGRSWRQSEVFGVAPDPTVIGTAGLLLLAERAPWKLLAVPLVWCLVSALTLWAMSSPEAILPAAAAIVILTAAGLKPEPESARREMLDDYR
ncbi:MAG TPA: DUF6064 family protein, partial [Gemmatimonadales bacterium]